MKPVKNARQLLNRITGENTTEKRAQELISHYAYKYTDCGAFASFEKDGVSVGSIVEGVDWGTETYFLKYPFTKDEYYAALDMVEKEAKDIWEQTHGCDDCFEFEDENGFKPINHDCRTCHGEGTIL